MKEKIKQNYLPVVAGSIAFLVILELLGEIFKESSLGIISKVLSPVIFLALFGITVIKYKDEMSFKGKLSLIALFITGTFALNYLNDGIYVIITRIFKIFICNLSILFSNFLYFAGFAVILMALLAETRKKLIPAGFLILAISEIVASFAPFIELNVIVFLTYVLLAAISFDKFEKVKKILRWIVIILVLTQISVLEIPQVLFFVIMALLLVPIGKIKLDFAKVIAILCVILAVITSITFMQNERMEDIKAISEEISSLKEERSNLDSVKDYEKIIAECDEKIEPLKTQKDALSKDYQNAEDALYEVCYFSSFNDYWCDEFCRPAHDIADAAKKKLNDCNSQITKVQKERDTAENKIERINFIKENTAKLSRTRNEYHIWNLINIIYILGLIFLAIAFWKKAFGKTALIACLLLAIESVSALFLNGESIAYWEHDILNYPFYKIILSFDFIRFAIISTLAAIFVKRESRPVKLRVLLIILSAISVIASLELFDVLGIGNTTPLFALIMIFAALLLVPLRYEKKISIAKFIFFTIITLGVWYLIWAYNVTKILNEENGIEKRKPLAELLLCIFLPLYFVYWHYKTAESIDVVLANNGKESNIKILSLIFGIFLPFVSAILIQDKINKM